MTSFNYFNYGRERDPSALRPLYDFVLSHPALTETMLRAFWAPDGHPDHDYDGNSPRALLNSELYWESAADYITGENPAGVSLALPSHGTDANAVAEIFHKVYRLGFDGDDGEKTPRDWIAGVLTPENAHLWADFRYYIQLLYAQIPRPDAIKPKRSPKLELVIT